ncbi:DNA-directed RNA polymerase 47 KD subunit [Fusarium heterosporum]|uniref:DNA-directed RNA polymerase 47 KD subunit n=1 Tax=Fusarium heterosporum TaxID=42747 RepID=A0A8H5SPR8_FUSHE|nr:DNA-directed RNA polymerase 47 KD subunit [Fusarium heterosporum]
MNRGRAPARGTRRGAAAAGSRATGESNADPSLAPAATGAASGSATPVPRSVPTTPGRGGTTTRATRAPAGGRFRPKNIRRDEAERDSIARLEEQKASERAADERKARGRSRFRSKRSRGDAMGRGGFGRVISGASGPFSAGAGGAGRGSGGWSGGGGGGGFGGGGRGFKSDSKPGFAQVTRYREARINADKLHVHTPEEDLDSEDEAMIEALNSRAVSVLPMGIYRREHKDEGVIVATTAELEAAENAQAIPPPPAREEESLWVDGDAAEPQPTDENTEDGGIWGNESNPPVIKKEPGLDDSMDLDIDTKTDQEDKSKGSAETPTPQAKKQNQDSEDAMIQADLEILANELGAVEISEGEEGKTEGPSNKDGRMYLFQFPPVLPPLKQVAQPKPVSKVKPEPGEGDDNVLESTPAAADANPVDLTDDMNGAGFNIPGFEDPEQKAGFMSSLLSSGGMVGQLKVRKSGRVEMDWGGSTMELSPATGMNFLTTAVIIEENDEKPRPGVVGGESIGMGKIMGRFVLAPKWDDEEEWEVSSEDLRVE